MAIRKKYPALGRGLDALIDTGEVKTEGSSNISEVDMELIQPNPEQPRREFDDDALQELANSIRQLGIITPITLRDMGDGTYIIIAGERRWRASQKVGLQRIPAYIRTVDDENMMEMALVENIQRQDLTALEIALAYQHLLEQYGMTQEQLSERVGKNRATVTNYLRLLKLPAPIQMGLKNREIEMGHARALLALDDPEAQIKLFSEKGSTLNAEYNVLKDSLSKFFQTKVQLTCSDKGKGKITIPFSNEQELERIIELFDQLNH